MFMRETMRVVELTEEILTPIIPKVLFKFNSTTALGIFAGTNFEAFGRSSPL